MLPIYVGAPYNSPFPLWERKIGCLQLNIMMKMFPLLITLCCFSSISHAELSAFLNREYHRASVLSESSSLSGIKSVLINSGVKATDELADYSIADLMNDYPELLKAQPGRLFRVSTDGMTEEQRLLQQYLDFYRRTSEILLLLSQFDRTQPLILNYDLTFSGFLGRLVDIGRFEQNEFVFGLLNLYSLTLRAPVTWSPTQKNVLLRLMTVIASHLLKKNPMQSDALKGCMDLISMVMWHPFLKQDVNEVQGGKVVEMLKAVVHARQLLGSPAVRREMILEKAPRMSKFFDSCPDETETFLPLFLSVALSDSSKLKLLVDGPGRFCEARLKILYRNLYGVQHSLAYALAKRRKLILSPDNRWSIRDILEIEEGARTFSVERTQSFDSFLVKKSEDPGQANGEVLFDLKVMTLEPYFRSYVVSHEMLHIWDYRSSVSDSAAWKRISGWRPIRIRDPFHNPYFVMVPSSFNFVKPYYASASPEEDLADSGAIGVPKQSEKWQLLKYHGVQDRTRRAIPLSRRICAHLLLRLP